VLEHDVGLAAEELRDVLREPARLLEARLLGVGVLVAGPHHALELVAVDVVDGAELLDELALVRGRHHADGLRTGDLAELRREHAQAAGGAPDEHAVAGLELDLVDQHPVGGEVGQAVGRGVGPAQVRGLRQQLLGLDLRELRE
jgi:hypothetical protein